MFGRFDDWGAEPLEPQETKELSEDQKLTVQERATQDVNQYGSGMSFMLLADTGATVPPWWSTSRDRFLSKDWLRCPLFSGAVFNVGAKLATIPAIIEPRDPRVKAERDLAEEYQRILYEGAEFGRGFIDFAMRWYQDRWCCDNGAFGEVLGYGPKDGPIRGRAVGLANLDSQRCTRTGNPEFPVVYQRSVDGKRYKLHYTRVIYGSQLPSTRDDMNGVGLCWYSRAAMVAQSIVDDLTFKQEKLGKRQQRAVLVGRKMSVDVIKGAFEMSEHAADARGLTRVGMMPIVANPNAGDVGIDLVSLTNMPDGFIWKDDVNIAMYIIALTGGFPVRWMWPATVVGATKADAMIQHMATAMSGTAHELGTLALALGGSARGMAHQTGKFLPPTLKIRFDVQDDWIDEVQAGIHNVRSQSYERNILDGAVTIRVAREQMLSTGEITEAQFREMELSDGRTQDGLPVDSLFYGKNPYLQGIDPDEFAEESVKARLKEAKRTVVQDPSGERKEEAREAVAALEWLLEHEEEEQREEEAPPPQAAPPAPTDGMDDQEEDEEDSGEDVEASKEVDKKRLAWERKVERDLSRLFDELRADALDAAEQEEDPDYDKWAALLAALLLGLLVKAFMDQFAMLEDEYSVAFDPAEAQVEAQRWAQAYTPVLVGRLVDTTQKVLNEALDQYAAGQMTQDELVEMLVPAFGEARARMVAITETTQAYSAAMFSYRELLEQKYGVRLALILRTAEDELVCEHICAPLNGAPETAWRNQYPSGPPLHIRCRCGLELVKIPS